jgi:ABC-type transporter Mla subunit MlaD
MDKNITVLIAFAIILAMLCITAPKRWIKSNNTSLINFIPTFCTSLGVFFSFALLFIRLGLQDIDMTDLKLVIKELSSKFVYSLIGVGFSIYWNWKIRKEQGEAELKLLKQNTWKQKDPQELLWLVLQTNLDYANKFQDYSLSQNKNHAELLRVFTDNVHQMRDQLKVLNAHAININKTVEEGKEVQSKNISNQQETLDNIHDFMQSAGDSLKNLLDDLKNQLENNIQAMGSDAAKKAAELHRVFEEFLKNRALEMEDNMTQSVRGVHERIQPALSSISEAANENANKLKTIFESINTVLDGLKSSLTHQVSEQFNTSENNLRALNDGLQQSLDRILSEKEEQITKTFDHLEELRGRSQTVLEQITQNFAASVNQYAEIQQNNDDVIQRIESQIKSIDVLEETSQKQIDHWNSRTNDMIELKNRVADIATTIEQLDSLNQKLGLLSSHKN